MIREKNEYVNLALRRGALLLEVCIVLVYEHVNLELQHVLGGVAVLAGIVAAVAFLHSSTQELVECPAFAGIENGVSEAEQRLELTHQRTQHLTAQLKSELWSAIVVENQEYARMAARLASLQIIELQFVEDRRWAGVQEVIGALTKANKGFTVELTNSDSILIHCESTPAIQSRQEHVARPHSFQPKPVNAGPYNS